ncbi:hypothetical protein RchiOBHm_Chr7g0194181 [Rosa chinensis]|uniref:Uncharacterized protein n=1 Tax=Rosa chinensis TaxID=74649 RepID=A0A2P6P605_ROSCH|nr:hypothetical protein RchiOBHm_Chr7g0194181 [Rosa chinensis]
MFSPSFLTLIHYHHHPKTFHVLGCNHHVFSIITHTNILHFHYFSSTHHFTLLFLPYINTFSSHSKTSSFIHLIFFVSPFPFHFLSIL